VAGGTVAAITGAGATAVAVGAGAQLASNEASRVTMTKNVQSFFISFSFLFFHPEGWFYTK
jgi:branched-subunit amino acid ABC-type transport system permease component